MVATSTILYAAATLATVVDTEAICWVDVFNNEPLAMPTDTPIANICTKAGDETASRKILEDVARGNYKMALSECGWGRNTTTT